MSISDISPETWALRVVGMACFMVAAGAFALFIVRAPRFVPPAFGLTGKRRGVAREHAWFRGIEPWLALLAGGFEPLLRPNTRSRLQAMIACAGTPLGLVAEEWLALSVLTSLLAGALAWISVGDGVVNGWVVAFTALGLACPMLRLRTLAEERAKALERSLPNAMDLCILCMGAGADFPGALHFAIQELGVPHAACREELSMVLDELRLGRTRVQALSALGERSRSLAVRDFVSSVCQSEVKGTPLAGALDMQARTLRQRRSVLAEEAAAKAGVKLMFPLMLLMLCILLLVVGPFLVQGGGW